MQLMGQIAMTHRPT